MLFEGFLFVETEDGIRRGAEVSVCLHSKVNLILMEGVWRVWTSCSGRRRAVFPPAGVWFRM